MTLLVLFILSTSGVNSLLLPASPIGVTTHFSVSRGAEAIFYNPANFEAGENYKIWCSYNRFYLSMQSVSLAMSKKIESISFGIAFLNFNYGDIEWHPPYPTEDSLTYYSANDFSIIIGGNAYISPRGKIGLNLKYITENIYVYSDYALAFDLSFAYTGSKTGISFGVTNFGTKITSNNEEVNLPARMSIGGFYDFKKFIPSADLHYLVNNGIFEFGLGVEIPINKFIALSGALHYRHTFYPGFGVAINSGKIGVKYAGSFYPADLGMINTIGIGFEF